MNIYTVNGKYGKMIGIAKNVDEVIEMWCGCYGENPEGAEKIFWGNGETEVRIQGVLMPLDIIEKKPMFVGAKYGEYP
jgi:hypothetical protein